MLGIDSEIEILPVPVPRENMSGLVVGLGLPPDRKRQLCEHDKQQQNDSDDEPYARQSIWTLFLQLAGNAGWTIRCLLRDCSNHKHVIALQECWPPSRALSRAPRLPRSFGPWWTESGFESRETGDGSVPPRWPLQLLQAPRKPSPPLAIWLLGSRASARILARCLPCRRKPESIRRLARRGALAETGDRDCPTAIANRSLKLPWS